MSEQFKPGQIVWHKLGGQFLIVHQKGSQVWVDGLTETHASAVLPVDWFTANKPNKLAGPVPQNCPHCSKPAAVAMQIEDAKYFVHCTDQSCGATGPKHDDPEEATSLWNLIMIDHWPTQADIEEVAHDPRPVQEDNRKE